VSGDRCRLDVWLWRARFFKTRSLAASAVEAGGVYLERNGQSRVAGKPATAILPGDGLSLRKGGAVRTLRVLALDADHRPRRVRSTRRLMHRNLTKRTPPTIPSAPKAATTGNPIRNDLYRH
jgi:ribosome-associated heat shock protein Hsp15